jgi:hypothetical protein
MECKGRRSWLQWTVALSALAMGGCIDGVVGQIDRCYVDGKGYAAGESFAASDGCNACTCLSDGKVSCTERACGGGAADGGVSGSCDYGGKGYALGEAFLATDGCNSCVCQEAGLVCTEKACSTDAGSDVGVCQDGKFAYPVGVTYQSADGCVTCTCQPDGVSACRESVCFGGETPDGGAPAASPGDAGLGTCDYGGKTYREGDAFGALDGCNDCSCLEAGVVGCTQRACAPTCSIGNGHPMTAGSSTLCEDGCNTCTCTAGAWVNTDRACPALSRISACPSALEAADRLTLRFVSKDTLGVTMDDALCKNGRFDDYTLCYLASVDDPSQQALVLALPTGSSVPCGALVAERVVDLTPLRDAYRAARGATEDKLILGSKNQRLYEISP